MKNIVNLILFIILFTYHLIAGASNGKIQVHIAEYGNFNSHETSNVTDLISNECHNKEKCDFTINNSLTQIDPCRGIPKQMKLTCSCDNSTKTTFYTLELTHISIKCTSHRIVVEELRHSPYIFTTRVLLAGCAVGSYIGCTTAVSNSSNYSGITLNIALYGLIGGSFSARAWQYFAYAYETYHRRV